MSKSIKQLNNNLIALNLQVKDLAEELQELNRNYLTYLMVVIKKQLMVATYQICTQKYPIAFLDLSYSQRTKLQEKIKELANSFPAQLNQSWLNIDEFDHPELQKLQENITGFLLSGDNQPQSTTTAQDIVDSSSGNSHETDSLAVNNDVEDLTAEDLIKLQIELDYCLEQGLIDLSNQVNQFLQEAKVLPDTIPSQILAIALQAEENTSVVSGAPNLLSVLIDKEPKSDEIDIIPIVAICLRINDLEFNDTRLHLDKQKIVKILNMLDNLNEKYQDLQYEYAIVQAEAAWRSSWYE